MLLAGDGRLSVDDDIRKYVPELPDYGTKITLRHLMNHTSGLRDQWDLLSLARGRFSENRITQADVMDIVPRQKALNFKPGAEYAYSNTGYTLLAVVVMRVSNKSLKEFADERIFKPLDMRSTHFHDDYTMLVPGRTSAYSKGKGTSAWQVSIPNFDTYGATSLFTTVGDLLKWEDNFRTLKVGSAQMFRQMETVAVLDNGKPTDYGLGLVMENYRGARMVGHNGADAGYRANVVRFPDKGLAIAIACNASTAATVALTRAMADALIGDELGKVAEVPQRKEQKFTEAELAKRAGIYVHPTTLQVISLTPVDGQLVLGEKGGPALGLIGDNRFQTLTGTDSVEFIDGKATGLMRHTARGEQLFFERQAPITLTTTELAAYQGEYVSEELGNARYRISLKDEQLMVATGTEKPTPVKPLYKHAFAMGSAMLQFQHNKGRISGFDITTGRTRHVQFVRVAGPAR